MDESLIRILMVLIGAIIGYRFRLFLVIRQEYNSAIEPIRLRLLKDQSVNNEMITELKSKLGNRANKIVHIYEQVYAPSKELDCNGSGYDDFGNEIEVDEAVVSKNINKQEEARKKLLSACKLK